MAKKSKKADAKPATLTVKDKKTLSSLRELAGNVVQFAERSRPPHFEVPSRSLSNVKYNQSRRIIEMGSGSNRRELFNLGQAKSFMQTVLVGSKCKGLIDQGKTATIRQIFFLCKHTIKGTSENTSAQHE